MMGHKICFYAEIWLIIPKLSLIPLPIWTTGEGDYERLSASSALRFEQYLTARDIQTCDLKL